MSGIKCIELIDIPTCKASYLWWHKVRFFLGWLNPYSFQHNSPHHHRHHLPITMIMHATPITRPNFTKSYHSYNDQKSYVLFIIKHIAWSKKKKKKCHSLLSMKLQYKFKWFDVLMNLLGKKTYGFFFFLKTFVWVFFSFLFIFVLYIRKTDWTLKNYSLFFSFFFLFFWFKGELLVKHTNDSLESPYLWRKSVE